MRFACHGECPKNRFLTTADGQDGLNYLCAGWYAFFTHIDRPLQIMASLLRAGRPASAVMQILAREDADLQAQIAQIGRNARCPCGSGRKVKQCHGRSQLAVNGHKSTAQQPSYDLPQGKPD